MASGFLRFVPLMRELAILPNSLSGKLSRLRLRLVRAGMCSFLAAAVSLALLCFAVAARAEKVEQLKPQGYVNDFAGVLDERARGQLAALCNEVDQKAHAQI